MKKNLLFIVLACAVFSFRLNAQDFYLIKIYHCKDPQQIEQIENYTAQQLIPFLHKQKVEVVGVFKPVYIDTMSDKKLFIWIPLKKLDQLASIEIAFSSINAFTEDPLTHLDSFQNKSPFERMETMLCSAFTLAPHYNISTSFQRSPDNVYEFRSYESATENLHLRKVHMFNEGGEIALFKRLNFNALFYSRCIIGAHMPNLIYMTRFENMEARNEHWKTFGNDPEWKKLSSMKEYAGTVSKNETILLKAASCSEL